MEIHEDQVRWELRTDVIRSGQLEQIADAAAGDARVAIGILRGSARHATQRGADTITDAHIKDTIPHAKAEIKRKNLQKLNTDQRLLYDIIADHDEITPGELYEKYEQQAPEPKTKRVVRNFLQKMCHYNLIVANGKNRGRTYQVRTWESTDSSAFNYAFRKGRIVLFSSATSSRTAVTFAANRRWRS